MSLGPNAAAGASTSESTNAALFGGTTSLVDAPATTGILTMVAARMAEVEESQNSACSQ